MAKEKPDFVLSDGTEIHFDFSKITMREWRDLVAAKLTPEEDDVIVANVSGIKPEIIPDMTRIEYRKFLSAFFKVASNPIDEEPKN